MQIEADSFAVNQNETRVDQLLPGTVELRVSVQQAQWEYELHRDRAAVRGLFSGQSHGCAEVYSVKIFMAFEVLEYRTNEMCDVLIEGQRVLGLRRQIFRGAAVFGSVVVTESCR